MYQFLIDFFRCSTGHHTWGAEEPYDCLICSIEDSCETRQCECCGYRQYRINGIWGDDSQCPLEKENKDI